MPERQIKIFTLLCSLTVLYISLASPTSAAIRSIKDTNAQVYGKDVKGGTQFQVEFSEKGGACNGYQTIDPSIHEGYGGQCGGKWKSFRCKADLTTCTSPQLGVGSDCNGKYASCKCPDNFTTYCNGSGMIATNPCYSGGKIHTTPENCTCNKSIFPYDSSNCTSPKILGGSECTNGNGSTSYETCSCPSEYTTCSTGADTNRSDYKSCTDSSGTKHNRCKCPSTFDICSSNQQPLGAECTDSYGKKHDNCTCESRFELCSSGSIGSGEYCSDAKGSKYSICQCPAGTLNLDTYYCNGALRCLIP